MNVLVYAGSESNPQSLGNALSLLRAVCLPNYTVQPLSKASFIKEPWEIGCVLLVLPHLNLRSGPSSGINQGSRVLDIFGPKEVKRIRNFVEDGGGAFLGLGLGARSEAASSPSSLESAMFNINLAFSGSGAHRLVKEEDEKAPLKFFDKLTNSYISPLLSTETGVGQASELVSLTLHPQGAQEGDTVIPDVYTSGATISGFEPTKTAVLATTSKFSPAVVYHPAGKGHIALLTVPLLTPSSPTAENFPPPVTLLPLLHLSLTAMGLQLPPLDLAASIANATASASVSSSSLPPAPLSQFLTSIPTQGESKRIVETITQSLFPSSDITSATRAFGTITDAEDTFTFLPLGSREVEQMLGGGHPAKGEGSQNDEGGKSGGEKYIIVCPDGVLPPRDLTPLFDLQSYYETLLRVKNLGLPFPAPPTDQQPDTAHTASPSWQMGEALLYGSRVTSTQSMFDRNPHILTTLPTPLLSLASHQLAGRGRGKNVWLSPEGCLMFSLLLRIELDTGGRRGGKEPVESKTGGVKGAKLAGTKMAEGTKTAKTTTAEGTKTTKTTGLPQSAKTTKTSASRLGPESEEGTASAKTSATSGLKTDTTGKGAKTTKTAGIPEGVGASIPPSLKSSDSHQQMAYTFSSPHPPSPSLPKLPASKLVFIQYLFALAVAQACRLPDVLGPELGRRVRVKWPNDLYVDLSEGDLQKSDGEKDWDKLKKIGGVLVNTNFGAGGKVEVVIGCGLNVLNAAPIASLVQLSQLHQPHTRSQLSLEKTVASIIATFERMWGRFVADNGSFEAFMGLYLDTWLHTDQRVTLTTVNPPLPVRIVGITPDFGLLRTLPEIGTPSSSSGLGTSGVGLRGTSGLGIPTAYPRYVYAGGESQQYIDLQPDGNSFDLMAGLIKAKTT